MKLHEGHQGSISDYICSRFQPEPSSKISCMEPLSIFKTYAETVMQCRMLTNFTQITFGTVMGDVRLEFGILYLLLYCSIMYTKWIYLKALSVHHMVSVKWRDHGIANVYDE